MSKNSICLVAVYSGSGSFELLPATAAATSQSVENNGFEPLTPCVQGRCSSQLS